MPVLALVAALALAQPPETARSTLPGGGCVRLGGRSLSFYPINDRTILVSAGLRAYRITVTPSPLLADRTAGIEARFRNSTVVCRPLELDLHVVSSAGRAALIAQDIQPLSAQVADRLRRGGPGIDRRRPGLYRPG